MANIPNDSELVEIAASSLSTERLLERNDHTLDRVSVPNALEDLIGEAKHDEILHHLFSQIVVYAIDFLLEEQFRQVKTQFV